MQNLVAFETLLEKDLKDPAFKKSFEKEKQIARLELKINDILRKTGNENYCVEVMDIDDY
jgi:hypothetical protein